MSFVDQTRRKHIKLSSQSKGTTNPIVWDVPKTGILAGIWLAITGSVAGTLSAPNALGMASIVRRVRLIANNGIDLINISGAGYHYLLRDWLEDFKDPVPGSNARSAVTATTFDISMFLPIALNSRDPIGLFMLQNEQTLLQLSVEFEADASVATGATVTATVVPSVEYFTVPIDPKDWPPFNMIHQIIEDKRAIAAAGDVEYNVQRGNTYVQILHGAGIGAAGADLWTAAKFRINQSDYLADLTPNLYGLEFTRSHGRARVAGTVGWDLIGTSGLGTFGSARDLLYSGAVTELSSILTFSGAGDLYTVRRQLIALEG